MEKGRVKMFVGGMVVGAAVAPIALFSLGWIVTSGAANAAAEELAQAAVIDSLAPICVSQFPEGESGAEQLAKLKSLSQWNRPDFVAESGWATMPGSSTANGLVASECARRLVELEG